MNGCAPPGPYLRHALEGETAADLMTPNVVTIPVTATIHEAVALLTLRNLSAVPVTNGDNLPVGVLSRSDIVAYDSGQDGFLQLGDFPGPDKSFLQLLRQHRAHDPGPRPGQDDPGGTGVLVRDIMTPVVFSVGPQTPAVDVVETMMSLNVHRLFVTEKDMVLVGVISATDILRHLCRLPAPAEPGVSSKGLGEGR
jgi:CBS domain-containing protein